jgi:hypothetical protein
LTFLARKTVDFESEDMMINQIFEVFNAKSSDKKAQLINSDDLKEILESLGEEFDEKEIEKLFKESSIYGVLKEEKPAIGESGF